MSTQLPEVIPTEKGQITVWQKRPNLFGYNCPAGEGNTSTFAEAVAEAFDCLGLDAASYGYGPTKPITPEDILAAGWEIVKDTETDSFRFRAIHFVEESGLCDTPEEAAKLCREYLEIPVPSV